MLEKSQAKKELRLVAQQAVVSEVQKRKRHLSTLMNAGCTVMDINTFDETVWSVLPDHAKVFFQRIIEQREMWTALENEVHYELREIEKEHEPSTETIPETIRRLRKEKGWPQWELANRAGVSQAYISVIESGASGTNIKTIERVLSALGYEIKIQPKG